MVGRALSVFGSGLMLALVVGPALAGIPDAIRVPEPATMSLFAAGAAGAFLVRKFGRRK